MSANVPSPQVRLDATGRIAEDVHCIHCGYDLRSLLPEQACPECGRPVEPSLRGQLLRFAQTAWLARLAGGMIWMIAGLLIWLADTNGFVFWLVPPNPQGATRGQMLVYAAVKVLEMFVFLVGVWKVTSPEPRLRCVAWHMGPRAMVRLMMTIAGVLLVIGQAWIQVLPGSNSPLPKWWWYLSPYGGHLGQILRFAQTAGCLALCFYLIGLARRVPATLIARMTLIIAVCLGLIGALDLGLNEVWRRIPLASRFNLAAPIQRWIVPMQMTFQWILLLQQVLLLVLAVSYWRLFRRQIVRTDSNIDGASDAARAQR